MCLCGGLKEREREVPCIRGGVCRGRETIIAAIITTCEKCYNMFGDMNERVMFVDFRRTRCLEKSTASV